jgi:hypothetical protein
MRRGSAFKSLDESQALTVLRALVRAPRLDWHEEDVLGAIARARPHLVIDFFGYRLALKAEVESEYNPIPFQFYRLHEVLIKSANYAVESARRWYETDPLLFVYRGGRFLTNVFQNAWPALETQLRPYVAGDESDLKFVLQVLRTFEGENFLHPIVKDLVARLHRDSDLLQEAAHVLTESGVVSGEFGFVELYKQRRDQMLGWLDDERAPVREFAEKHIRSLERMIAVEQRRAEEDYEMRKREWGIEDDEPKKEE